MITVTEDSLKSIKEQVKAANLSLEHKLSFLARHIVACIRENKHTQAIQSTTFLRELLHGEKFIKWLVFLSPTQVHVAMAH